MIIQKKWHFVLITLLFFFQVPVSAEAEAGVKEDNNLLFSLALFSRLRAQSGNVAFSPYSIEEALALTLVGAKGETAKQISSVLGYKELGNCSRLHALDETLSDFNSVKEFQLTLANSLWGEKKYHFIDEFVATAKKDFFAEIHQADFQNAAESARKEINAWVGQKTNDKIKNLISPGMVNALTKLVIVNAVYFKALWAVEFDSKNTAADNFWLAPGKPIDVWMMKQEGKFRFAESKQMKLLEMPYRGGNISMVFLLPKERDGISAMETSLTPTAFEELASSAVSQQVRVQIPKFKSASETSLASVLEDSGIADAFDEKAADFSGMDGTKHLYVSGVIHQAVVEVDEKGTEAAAATAIMTDTAAAKSVEPLGPEFIADHPFLFFIRENRRKSILFMGRVTSPSLTHATGK